MYSNVKLYVALYNGIITIDNMVASVPRIELTRPNRNNNILIR